MQRDRESSWFYSPGHKIDPRSDTGSMRFYSPGPRSDKGSIGFYSPGPRSDKGSMGFYSPGPRSDKGIMGFYSPGPRSDKGIMGFYSPGPRSDKGIMGFYSPGPRSDKGIMGFYSPGPRSDKGSMGFYSPGPRSDKGSLGSYSAGSKAEPAKARQEAGHVRKIASIFEQRANWEEAMLGRERVHQHMGAREPAKSERPSKQQAEQRKGPERDSTCINAQYQQERTPGRGAGGVWLQGEGEYLSQRMEDEAPVYRNSSIVQWDP
ncbi:hypothetical protein NDU88_004877 [Pleurodeles waltl]|uniref:Uncharacterized protein n=1 Tax=Pleurodeles waltl TaxID=8319 RepID=A0AAV7V5Q0_PLEWA|nr:hypothetical protein NDU88_004877 [Pleurodeles waltl]